MAAVSLTYELCVGVMDAFKQKHPDVLHPSLLGLSVAMDGSSPILKISVTEIGMAAFSKDVSIPKVFEHHDSTGKKTGFKTVVFSVPVIAPPTGKKSPQGKSFNAAP